MSNQTIFQEKNARLNVNNTDLNSILNTVRNLPEAGSDITLQEKTVTPSKSTQNIVADAGYTGLSEVTINPIGDEYIIPSGTIETNENGTFYIAEWENIVVNVPNDGITPTGTITIDENGTYDVTNYANATVDVMVGVFPAGAMEITENGIYDVTYYGVADVNVPTGGDTSIEDSIVTRTITSYTNDRITKIGSNAFRGSSITSISCSNVTTIEAYGLESCASLTDVNLPSVTTLKNYAMQKCTSLVRLEFQQKITTQGAVWLNCSALTTLVLRGSTMSGLGNKNCFNGTPIASGTGYIYVPDDLVDTYKANTNWANYADQIKGLSELPS